MGELDLGELVEEEEDPGELEHQARTSAINSTTLAFVGLGSLSRALITGENPHGCGADQAAQLHGEVKRLTAQVAALQLANETMQRESEALRRGTDIGTVVRLENERLRAEIKILLEQVSAGSPMQAIG